MIPANRTALSRWPNVLAAIDSAADLECMASDSPVPTLVIGGVQLTSGYNRLAEANTQISSIKADSLSECWVYGFALGDIPQLLLARPGVNRVHVVILSAATAKASLSAASHAWLSDDRVELQLASDEPLHKPYFVAPAEVHFAEPWAHSTRDRLAIALSREFDKMSLATWRDRFKGHVKDNREFVELDSHVSALFAARIDRAVVCMAGPTLTDQLEWLRTQDAPIIAASRVLRDLQAAGITPLAVVVVDSDPVLSKHLDGVDLDRLSGVSLVYDRGVSPEFVRRWTGRRYHCYAEGGDLYTGGSVLHSTVDLAVRMGAKDVTLVGVDLCNARGKSHVGGEEQNEPWRPRTVNGLGESVTTRGNLIQFKWAMENYIDQNPQVKFYKRGKEGAPLKGAEWME